jgi:hypothetical protein
MMARRRHASYNGEHLLNTSMFFAQSIGEYGGLERITTSLTALYYSFTNWLYNSPRELWLFVFTVVLVAFWFWKRPRKF